jgi:hypothetical protein
MKRFIALCLATGAVGVAVAPAASADPSSPPDCFGQEHAAFLASGLGNLGDFTSDWVHYFNSRPGENEGQTGIPQVKALCPTLPPPAPGG